MSAILVTPALNTDRALYIDGQWVQVAPGSVEPVLNPATEEVIGHAPVGTKQELDMALAGARRAFDQGPWPRMKAAQRAAQLQKFHQAIMRRADSIRALICAEAGATAATISTLQFATPMDHAQYFIDQCTRDPATSLPVDITPLPDGTKMLGMGVSVREPVGVVLAITPFNFPFMLNVSKIFPALAAGNTVVLKPSPYTPFEALVLGEAAHEAGLPKGVLNVVTGDKAVGEMLTSDPRVDLISFTGSDQVGAAIQAQSAPTLKRLLLELGGKSALIVRQDADLQGAVLAAVRSNTQHAGQSCAATTRLLVHNSIRGAFVKALAAQLQGLKLGNPVDASVNMGPLIRASQRDRAESYTALGLREGAKLITGGRRPAALERGFFYEPTLFDEVDNRWRIAQEEVFGPVMVVIGFDTDEQAIAIANDSPFGLAGGVFSADVGRAYEIALQLRTGRIAINGGTGNMSAHAPFGGIKRSGYGREFGLEGLNEYTYIKNIGFHAG